MRVYIGNRIRVTSWNARKWSVGDPYDRKGIWLRQALREFSPQVCFLFELEGNRTRSNRLRAWAATIGYKLVFLPAVIGVRVSGSHAGECAQIRTSGCQENSGRYLRAIPHN